MPEDEGWHSLGMAHFDLPVTKDLRLAIEQVLGVEPAMEGFNLSVQALAAFLDSCAKGYGLSESLSVAEDPLDRLEGWPVVEGNFADLLGSEGVLTTDGVRARVYEALCELSRDGEALRLVNKRDRPDARATLLLGQIHWNLEATEQRTKLPIKPAPATGSQDGRDIPVPQSTVDLATTSWTARTNLQWSGRTSGQGFRTAAARLTVLVARWFVENQLYEQSVDQSMSLHRDETGQVVAVRWEDAPAARDAQKSVADLRARADGTSVLSGVETILIGSPGPVGAAYQVRWQDFAVREAWEAGSDARVWLAGAPGTGKSFSARKIVQDALADRGSALRLVLWVGQANPETVRAALVSTCRRLSAAGLISVGEETISDSEAVSYALAALRTSDWAWIVVYDDADGDALLAADLVPTHEAGRGRFLATTNSRSVRLAQHGALVSANLFQEDEAESYLRQILPADVSGTECRTLALELGLHPLALAIAGATIVAHQLSVEEWLRDFRATDRMDEVGDEPDLGGHAGLMAATWLAALERATSSGLPRDVLERAAAVVALQASHGHPTWLWDAPEIDEWVGGGAALARRHHVPQVLRTLADHQVVKLLGGTWSGGAVAIHQLAARAVLEHVPHDVAGQAALVVAQAWLREVTGERLDKAVMHANVVALAARDLGGGDAQGLLSLLINFAEPDSPDKALASVRRTRKMAPALRTTGALGAVAWACMLARDASELAHSDPTRSAGHRGVDPDLASLREEALGTLDGVLALASLDSRLRAKALLEAAKIHRDMGDASRAEALEHEAATLGASALREPSRLEAPWIADFLRLQGKTGDSTNAPAALEQLRSRPSVSDVRVLRPTLARQMNLLGHAGAEEQQVEVAYELLGTYDGSEPNLWVETRYLSKALSCFVRVGDLEAALQAAVLSAKDSPLDSSKLELASVRQRRGESDRALADLREVGAAAHLRRSSTVQTGHPLDAKSMEEFEEIDAMIEDFAMARRWDEVEEHAHLAHTLDMFEEAARLMEAVHAHEAVRPGVDVWRQVKRSAGRLALIGFWWEQAEDVSRAVVALRKADKEFRFLAESGRPEQAELSLRYILASTLRSEGELIESRDLLIELLEGGEGRDNSSEGKDALLLAAVHGLLLEIDVELGNAAEAIVRIRQVLGGDDVRAGTVCQTVVRALTSLRQIGHREEVALVAMGWIDVAVAQHDRRQNPQSLVELMFARMAVLLGLPEESDDAPGDALRSFCSTALEWAHNPEALADEACDDWRDPTWWRDLSKSTEDLPYDVAMSLHLIGDTVERLADCDPAP